MGQLLRRHDEYLRQESTGEGSAAVTADQSAERAENELVADTGALQTADSASAE